MDKTIAHLNKFAPDLWVVVFACVIICCVVSVYSAKRDFDQFLQRQELKQELAILKEELLQELAELARLKEQVIQISNNLKKYTKE